MSARARTAWLALGGVGLIVAVAAIVATTPHTLTATRAQAEAVTRRAIADRGVQLGPRWRVMPVPLDGSGGTHEFVAETAGEARRQELIGKYLPAPGWSVRAATFQGDVADRAEEWGRIRLGLGRAAPAAAPGAGGAPGRIAGESEARAIAVRALSERRGLDVARGQAREVSATLVQAEGAHGLDLHVRRHHDRSAPAGRAPHRGGDCGRRGRLPRARSCSCRKRGNASSVRPRPAT